MPLLFPEGEYKNEELLGLYLQHTELCSTSY